MAMLAERRRKQKWSLNNPRGKDWAEDSNKFGQKMLEKMGWSQGKGLGANENGMTEHVKLSYKNDSQGIGYKESNDQWTEHEQNFSSLLENLTGAKPELNLKEVSSLEKKSQTSRARVHYHKFTRGKDLSRYSEKDLANIFGKKTLKESKKPELTEEKPSSIGTTEIKSENSSFTINGGSMADYFKKKMSGFGKNTHGYVIGSNGVLKKEDPESESEIRNFGFGFTTVVENSEKCNNVVNNKENEVKIKKKHVKSSFVSYVEGENINEYQNQNGNTDYSTPNNKKRKVEDLIDEEQRSTKKLKKCKKQKKPTENEECQGITNLAFDPLRTPIKLDKHILDPIEENEDSFVMDENSTIISSNNIEGEKRSGETSLDIDNNEKQVNKKSKKKKNSKKMASGVENSVFYDEITSQNSFGVDTVENCKYNEKKLKKKTKKKLDEIKNGVENFVFDGGLNIEECDKSQTEDNPYEVKIVNKKKDKRKKKCGEEIGDLAIVNPNFSLNSSNETSTINEQTATTVGEFEVKRKNKKSKKKKGCVEEETDKYFAIENPIFNDSLEANNFVIVQEDISKFEVRRKLKKEKKQKHEREVVNVNSFDNPALNLNDKNDSNEQSLTFDLMLNVTDDKTIEDNSSTKVVNARFTITKVNTVKRRKSVRFSDVHEEILIPNNEELKEMERRQELIEINKEIINSSEEPIFDIQLNVDSSPQNKERAQSNTVDDDNDRKKNKKSKRNKQEKGVTNNAFDTQKHILEENVETISKTLEKYQAEIENDINEKKAMEETSEDLMTTNMTSIKTVEIDDVMVGEVGNPHGKNARLPDGSVKLKFKDAKFGKSASYIDGLVGPRKSYKHLIKGDIVLNFKESNLHEIEGYASSLMHVRETAV